MLLPDPADVPPQLPEYHCQEAPVPNEPPLRVSVVDVPTHNADTVDDMDVAGDDG